MSRNKPGSVHASTPKKLRHRKPINLTLPPETIEFLDEISEESNRSRSEIVEDALFDYKTSRSKLSSE